MLLDKACNLRTDYVLCIGFFHCELPHDFFEMNLGTVCCESNVQVLTCFAIAPMLHCIAAVVPRQI
jgi:hypothetical protein